MQTDVRFGLILAVGIALACGSKRLSFTTPGDSLASSSVVEEASGGGELHLASSSQSPKPSPEATNSALADLFPADLRNPVKEMQPKPSQDDVTKSRPSPKEPVGTPQESSKIANENSEDLLLPSMDWVDETEKKDGSEIADRPKRMPEEPSKPQSKGPANSYFQRYLDDGAYFVREGDSLAGIAHNLYQDADKAQAILDANAELLKSADDIQPGMRLKLPKS